MGHPQNPMTQNSQPFRTRFAPSPTGFLHIGGARTALFAWLIARHSRGQFILRIEDTDQERSTQASVDAIVDGLEWLGLDLDEGPLFQSQRQARYQAVVDDLLARGLAYRCYCSKERLASLREAAIERGDKPRYDGHCRELDVAPEGVDPVIRFKNPTEGVVAFHDHVYGNIEVANSELDDLVIMRADGSPTYNFAVVVDDSDMGINLVLRGDDHINNTPRQINLYHALGVSLPEFAHVPMILGPDGRRYSKRHGAQGVLSWREDGFLPSAMINYLARLGWSHGDQEVFSLDALIEQFSLDGINRKAARFDIEKLTWLNHHYLRHGDQDEVVGEFRWHLGQCGYPLDDGVNLQALLAVQVERLDRLDLIAEQSAPFFVEFDDYDPAAAKKHLRPVAIEPLQHLLDKLKAMSAWTPETCQAAIQSTADDLALSFGKIGMPLRVALMGHGQSPPINETLALMGPDRAVARIERAIAWMEKRVASSGG